MASPTHFSAAVYVNDVVITCSHQLLLACAVATRHRTQKSVSSLHLSYIIYPAALMLSHIEQISKIICSNVNMIQIVDSTRRIVCLKCRRREFLRIPML